MQEEREEVLVQVVRSKIDLRGVYAPPSIMDTLWVQIIISPYTFAMWIYWLVNWHYRINVKRQEYTEEDKIYLLRKNFKLSYAKYTCMPEDWKKETMDRECWIKEKFDEYSAEKREEEHQKLIQSCKFQYFSSSSSFSST